MNNLSKTIQYRATSKHPRLTAYFMAVRGAQALLHKCSELTGWELMARGWFVKLNLYYDGMIDGKMHENEIQKTLETYWKSHGTKFTRISNLRRKIWI